MARTYRKDIPRRDKRRVRNIDKNIRDFSGKKLNKVNFKQVNLRKANFSGSSLRQAEFHGAILENANFENADLYGADFSNVKANGANFRNANAEKCIFDGASLDNSNLVNVNANDSSMWKARLCNANLTGAQITNANLEKANIKDSNFSRTNLTESNLKHVKADRANFSNSIMYMTNLTKAEFNNADMTHASIERAIANETKFIETTLICTVGSNLDASKAKFVNCNMRMAQFSESCLVESEFLDCEVYGASFWNIDNAGMNAKNFDLSEISDKSLLTDEIMFAPLLFLINQGKYFIDLINVMKLKSVLILGKDTGSNLKLLKEIQSILRQFGYLGIIAREQNDIIEDSTIRKIATLAMLSSFVIVENSNPSGHLFELPFIRHLECLTIVMQEIGKGSTWMFEDMYSKYSFIVKKSYTEDKFEKAVKSAVKWANKMLERQGKEHLSINIWLKAQLI